MNFIRLSIEGLVLIEPALYKDNRGFFFESYNQKLFEQNNIKFSFVQDNQSFSRKNVVRGLHFQEAPFEQGKLVSVIKGRVLDVAVDIRRESPSLGKHVSVELSGENKRMLWIPPGFAHGFSVFEEDTIFSYKCTNFYNKASEKGIFFNDSVLKIDWCVSNPVVSEKDILLPTFEEYKALRG